MVSRFSRQLGFLCVMLFAASSASAADFDLYREFRLGASTTDIVASAKAPERDLKTVHARPALLQELSWRPPYVSSRDESDGESIRGIVFSFLDNQLYKMVVEYDPARTEGLTREDMIAALTTVYGVRSPLGAPAARRAGYEPIDAPTPIAQWREGETLIVLQHSVYAGRFALAINSVPLDQKARQMQAAAVTLEAREAPAREAARQKDQAAAAKDAAEKTRTTNKATFEP